MLVPHGSGRPGIVGLGGETTVRVGPEDDVRLERAVAPVDVLEVLGGDDCDVEIERALRWPRGGHGFCVSLCQVSEQWLRENNPILEQVQ